MTSVSVTTNHSVGDAEVRCGYQGGHLLSCYCGSQSGLVQTI